MSSAHRHGLPEGTRLEEYRIDRVLGSGGFGITYLAWDENMMRPVAIKEYLPSDLAVREQNLSVYAKSTRDEEIYGWGLDRFREEAQTLARFDHPHIVRVLRFLTANNTAYMVMQYVEGETLGDVLKRRGVLGEEELRGLMVPLLDGLEAVHKAGILHRDIKPGNIYVRKDGSPVLLDFGAARQSIQGRTRSMTAVLTPPYAPFEQYGKAQKQGPWTDIYAFSAVLYQAVSGRLPPDAPDRVADEDPFEPTAGVARGRYSQDLLAAIDHALKPRGSDRPQSIEQWRTELWPAAKPSPPRPVIHQTRPLPNADTNSNPNSKANDFKLLSVIAAVGVTLIGGFILFPTGKTPNDAALKPNTDYIRGGPIDTASLRRGFQVYRQNCSACHSLNRVAFHSLSGKDGLGFTEAQVKELAASVKVPVGRGQSVGIRLDGTGDLYRRPGTPADHFPSPYLDEKTARDNNAGALPPDLSIIGKARADGALYIYSFLTGYYGEPPTGPNGRVNEYYNPYVAGQYTAMPPPFDNSVAYSDGTKATLTQEAHDVVGFLMWTSEVSGSRLELALIASDPAKGIERILTRPGDIERIASAVGADGRPNLEIHLATGASGRINGSTGIVGRKIALLLDGSIVIPAAVVQEPIANVTVINSSDLAASEIKHLIDVSSGP